MPPFPHPIYNQHVLQPAYHDALAILFDPMLAAHEAHALVLAECSIISPANAVALLDAVAQSHADGADAVAYQPGVEDLFFRIEARIIELAGLDFGGNLQLARSRNDLGQALARMAFRQPILALYGDLLALRQVIVTQARSHLHTLMPGYTHTQPAQPVTFAHYLAGVLTFLGKDQTRLAAAYTNVNESPLGAAAFTGTGFGLDRQRLADLLGFDTVVTSTHHSIGAGDHLTYTLIKNGWLRRKSVCTRPMHCARRQSSSSGNPFQRRDESQAHQHQEVGPCSKRNPLNPFSKSVVSPPTKR